MTKPTEQEIEHVARAMCEAMGKTADEPVVNVPGGSPMWTLYTADATKFLAGHYAMKGWA